MDRAHLRALLSRHPAADSTEAQHRDAMLALLDTPADPFHRSHFEPGHFTASAFVLSPNQSQLLLIFHGKLHRWLQPGGHIDPEDADIFAAARREISEETGVTDLSPVGELFDLDVHVIPARKTDPAHAHFDVRLLFRAGSAHIRAGSDASAARWVPLAEISGIESDESVMRAVRKIQQG